MYKCGRVLGGVCVVKNNFGEFMSVRGRVGVLPIRRTPKANEAVYYPDISPGACMLNPTSPLLRR